MLLKISGFPVDVNLQFFKVYIGLSTGYLVTNRPLLMPILPNCTHHKPGDIISISRPCLFALSSFRFVCYSYL